MTRTRDISLKGELKTFPLATVLQMLATEGRTGELKVTSGYNTVRVYFHEGDIVYAAGADNEESLKKKLKRKHIADSETIDKCNRLARDAGFPVIKVLFDDGYIEEDQFREINKDIIKGVLYNLFLLKDGAFEYEESEPVVDKALWTELRTLEVVLEGTRRVDEMAVLKENVPDGQTILKLKEDIADDEKIGLNADEWSVLVLVDGRRTTEDIVLAYGHEKLVAYKILYSLVSSGLIEAGQKRRRTSGLIRASHTPGVTKSGKKKILIADDKDAFRNILRFSLKKAGYKVTAVADGLAAFKCVQEESLPDLIVLDISMPGMDGYEVAEKLKGNEKTRHIPIIFLTARAQKTDVETGIAVGADDYIVKPYKFIDLKTKIEKLTG